MTQRALPVPSDLKDAGTVLWRKLTREFVFSSVETELAHQLCVTIDEIAAMKSDLSEMGMIVSGSNNQPKVNPIVSALVAHRRLCDQLVVALGLPAQGEAVGRRRSAQAKHAVDARWRRAKAGPRVHVVAEMLKGGA